MRGATKREGGFTLMEMMAVLAVGAIVLFGAYKLTTGWMQRANLEQFAALQAQEMLSIGRAAADLAQQSGEAWTAGTPRTITWAELTTRLPGGFATRDGLAGRAPLGDAYRVVVLKDAEDPPNYRIVVADRGSVETLGRTMRIGLSAEAATLQRYRVEVATRIVRDHAGIAGVMPATSWTAAGVSGLFAFALNAAPRNFFSGTASTHPVTVALVGWPEFDTSPVGPTLPPITPTPGSEYSNCTLIEKPSTFNVCPTGTVEADVINGCHGVSETCEAVAFGTIPAGPGCFLMRSTPIGTYTFGRSVTLELPLGESSAGHLCPSWQSPCGTGPYTHNFHYTGTLSFNDVKVREGYECGVNAWRYNSSVSPPTRRAIAGPSSIFAMCCQPR